MRRLCLVLGDQLDASAALFDDFDPNQDALWMAEVENEVEHVPCHKLRIAFFFSAMRHFRDEQREAGREVHYHEIEQERGRTFAEVLAKDLKELQPEELAVTEPGDWRVREELRQTAERAGVPLTIVPDRHFYCSVEDFREWASGRRSLVLETFYRWLRGREGVMLDERGEPAGGQWNFDEDNRESFGKDGPGKLPPSPRQEPDAVTQEVLEMVEKRFSSHPGRLEHFDLPVSRAGAKRWLADFIEHRLPSFGRFQDAMWQEEPLLYHSRLSPLLNVKLLSPRECVEAAVEAWRAGRSPINSVEGFVRQILGWREFVRGIYWTFMPEYIERNALECEDVDVPQSYWDGETEMECAAGHAECLGQRLCPPHPAADGVGVVCAATRCASPEIS
ncbi:MAG: cryptochrome/photolyase family protein [Bryobacterales bacterium]